MRLMAVLWLMKIRFYTQSANVKTKVINFKLGKTMPAFVVSDWHKVFNTVFCLFLGVTTGQILKDVSHQTVIKGFRSCDWAFSDIFLFVFEDPELTFTERLNSSRVVRWVICTKLQPTYSLRLQRSQFFKFRIMALSKKNDWCRSQKISLHKRD